MKNNLVCTAACIWLIILPFSGFSQKQGPGLIDSLEKAAARPGEDTSKVLTLLSLSDAWSYVDLNKAFPTVKEALRLAEKLHYIKGIANAENNLGLYMSDTGNQVNARSILKEVIRSTSNATARTTSSITLSISAALIRTNPISPGPPTISSKG